jgi:uncharacterized membrane protein (UPF0127 family)
MSVRINGQIFPAEYMTTPDQISKGMMGRENLDGCMVFKMKKGHHSFWMQKCKIPLDIVFVLNNRINKIHRDCQPCMGDCPERYSGMGDHVIEFPAGTTKDWKENDRVMMYLGTPLNPVV